MASLNDPLSKHLEAEYGILPPVADSKGTKWRENGVLVVGQDPSVSTRAIVTVALMLNNQKSPLAGYVSRDILAHLGWRLDEIAGTNLITTRFPTTLYQIARDKHWSLTELVERLAREGWPEFEGKLHRYYPHILVTLGCPVFSALNEILGTGARWDKQLAGNPISLKIDGAERTWVPCVHIRTYKRWPFHREHQPLNLRHFRDTSGGRRG